MIMGFDVYGLNPEIQEGSVKPEIDWNTNPSGEERKAYFEQSEKYEDENKGVYFRNNVWWWRRLAAYIYENVDEISEDDYGLWHENSGHQVDKDIAIKIADKLEELIKQGHTAEYQMQVEEAMTLAEKHNAEIEEKMKSLRKLVIKMTGKKDIAPADYPEIQSKKWENLYSQKSWNDSYPFSVENVQDFADFSRHSGGFEIC
tara:strand:- start:386 stop:991 length:606 start_codon:yes stop_codon:yes gene_type:complete